MGRRSLALGGVVRVGAIFPGQGSQTVGMGADVATHSRAASDVLQRAGQLLGYDLPALLFSGPEERLRETRFSQPAIFATNLALYSAVGSQLEPTVSAGHSFAEFCSLVVSGSLPFGSALQIVNERGRAMQRAAEAAPGGMSAVIGLEAHRVREIAERVQAETGQCVQLANYNAPTQIVISGDLRSVTLAGAAMLDAGAKRVVPLNVSGAWHSRLMTSAMERFAKTVEAAKFAIPAFDVISNVDASPYRDVDTIKTNLVRSIAHEVRWHDTAQRLLSYDLEVVAEFGAGGVLGPLMKRIPGAPTVVVVSDYAGVEKLRQILQIAGARPAAAAWASER